MDALRSILKNVKVPIKMTDIKAKIMQYDDSFGVELYKQIFEEDKETVVKQNIKRIIPKVSLTL